jgi:hypothetical protein
MFTGRVTNIMQQAMNSNTAAPPQVVSTRAVRTGRDSLAMVAHVCIVLATMGYAVDAVRQTFAKAAAPKPSPEIGEISEQVYTNATSAHFTFTNLNAFSAETCVKGIVRPKGALGPTAESVAVCTGEMKPRTTVVLEAPYRVGAIEALCSGETDRFGNSRLDWGKCSFTSEKVSK